ncbi:hypothetical protein MKX08_006554 [Trichoderma sp. CBMAI-0020]|nr:hypothetical protein MKX08_006554 [Trichoderma sp. CBMAI-0020]
MADQQVRALQQLPIEMDIDDDTQASAYDASTLEQIEAGGTYRFLHTQVEPFSPKVLRQKVQNRVRVAKRWADLISGSIFIAAAYNDKAEMMM